MCASKPGQVVALVIGPRDGSHVCDLTAMNVTLSDGSKTWDLAKGRLAKHPQRQSARRVALPQPAREHSKPAPDVPAPIAEWRKKPSPELAVKVRRFLEKDFPLNSPLLRPFLSDRSGSSDKSDITAQGSLR
jgi:hypothetical protein